MQGMVSTRFANGRQVRTPPVTESTSFTGIVEVAGNASLGGSKAIYLPGGNREIHLALFVFAKGHHRQLFPRNAVVPADLAARLLVVEGPDVARHVVGVDVFSH